MKCVNHPLSDAVAYCGQCGRALCSECKREVSGTVYCENCLAARLHSPAPRWGGAGTGPSPGVALTLGFIPGVGAIYNGQFTKAISQVLIFGCLITMGHRVHHGLEVVFVLGAWAFYFYMVIDSYQTAKAKANGQPVPEWFGVCEMKLNAPVGAALLIGLGILFLLDNLGVPIINQLSRFWPALLIVAGFLLLQRRLGGGTSHVVSPTPELPPKPPDGANNFPGTPGS